VPEKGREKSPSSPGENVTTPEEYPTFGSSQAPSGDYSYTVELVSTVHHEIGKLTEAVDSLKTQSQAHTEELKALSRDIYAAKVVLGVVGSGIIGICAFIAWLINTYLSVLAAQ